MFSGQIHHKSGFPLFPLCSCSVLHLWWKLFMVVDGNVLFVSDECLIYQTDQLSQWRPAQLKAHLRSCTQLEWCTKCSHFLSLEFEDAETSRRACTEHAASWAKSLRMAGSISCLKVKRPIDLYLCQRWKMISETQKSQIYQKKTQN